MLTWESYFERVIDLRSEFHLAATAIDGWAQSQDALDRYTNDELENLRHMFRQTPGEENENATSGWVFSDNERIMHYLDEVRATVPQRVSAVRSRLLQHEYVLHVAIFESFMKALHREVLRAAPTLLRADRKIDLGRLVSQGHEALIRAEIEREVQSLDRETPEKKSNYFRDRLKINWFDGKIVGSLDRVIRLRNTILHENPDQIVGEVDHTLLSIVTTAVTFASIAGAAVLYPAACSLPANITEAEVTKFVART